MSRHRESCGLTACVERHGGGADGHGESVKGRTSEGLRKTWWALLQATVVDEGESRGQKLPVRTQGARAELGQTPFYLLPLVGSVRVCILVGAGSAKPGGFLGRSVQVCLQSCVRLRAPF